MSGCQRTSMRDRTVGAGTRPARTEARRPGAQLVATRDGGDIRYADDGDDEGFDDGEEEEDDDEEFDDGEEDEVDGDEEVADCEGDDGDEVDEDDQVGDEEEDDDEIEDDDEADPYRFLLEEDDRAPNLEEWS